VSLQRKLDSSHKSWSTGSIELFSAWQRPESEALAELASLNFVAAEDTRRRLKHLDQMGLRGYLIAVL